MKKKQSIGTVTLVGAGPGQVDLLTIKAKKTLEKASVILVDDLVSESVLALAPQARVIYVGKRGGRVQSTPQAQIEQMIVTEALQGETVVRLKGGDPFIFGRGGEEIEAISEAGITVDVISGITAGLAAATSLAIPLTHRDKAQGVMYLTGHARLDAKDPHWETIGACAQTAQLTLVIYMGIKAASKIQAGLSKSMDGETPAVVIENATRPNQREVFCTLSTLAKTIQTHELKSPSIIMIGYVISQSKHLSRLFSKRCPCG